MFSNFRKGSVSVQSGMSLFDTIGIVRFLEPVQPAGVPFTPKSSWALTLAAPALKAELFSAQAHREPPRSPPTSNISFSCRDNFIHLVHHCIQLNAETMLTLE